MNTLKELESSQNLSLFPVFVPLALCYDFDLSNTESCIKIESLNEVSIPYTNITDERSVHHQINSAKSLLVIIFLIISLIIGWLSNIIIFKYFYRNGVNFIDRPINGLILINQIINNVGATYMIISDCLLYGLPLLIGNNFSHQQNLNIFRRLYIYLILFQVLCYQG